MWLLRLAAALALFDAFAFTWRLSFGENLDRAATVWLQRAAPAPDVPAATLVFLGNAQVIIPVLAAAAFIVVLLGDARRGRALLWLTIATVGITVLTAVLEHSIVHTGPPLALKRHLARPADLPTSALGFIAIPVLAGLAGVLLLLQDVGRGRAARWLAGAAVAVGLVVLLGRAAATPGVWLMLTGGVMRPWSSLYATPLARQLVDVVSPINGYPSGHVIRTTLLAGTLLARVPALAVAIVVSMMASLVYLGDHWLSEVLGGFCLGWACVEIARATWQPED